MKRLPGLLERMVLMSFTTFSILEGGCATQQNTEKNTKDIVIDTSPLKEGEDYAKSSSLTSSVEVDEEKIKEEETYSGGKYGCVTPYFEDYDIDGYGNPHAWVCKNIEGYVLDNLDCEDGNILINPKAIEICDNIDNNCNGKTDENAISHKNKICKENSVYWENSCGKLEDIVAKCDENSVCADGVCVKCKQGNILWADSNGGTIVNTTIIPKGKNSFFMATAMHTKQVPSKYRWIETKEIKYLLQDDKYSAVKFNEWKVVKFLDIGWSYDNKIDTPIPIAVTPTYDGNYVLAGLDLSEDTFDQKTVLVKFNGKGDILFKEMYPAMPNGYIYEVHQMTSKEYLILGDNNTSLWGDVDGKFLKKEQNEFYYSSAALCDDDYIITGLAFGDGISDYKIKIQRKKISGEKMWDISLDNLVSYYSFPRIIPAVNSNDYIVSFSNQNDSLSVVRISKEGQTIWNKTYPKDMFWIGESGPIGSTTTEQGNIILSLNKGIWNSMILKLNQKGEVLYTKDPGYSFFGVSVISEGEYLLAGRTVIAQISEKCPVVTK